jgi:microcystin-dependent protein
MFTVPGCGAAPVTVTVADSSWFTPGLLVFIPGAGTFTVVGSPPSPNTVQLASSCDPANAAAGTQISAGVQVSPAALQGATGAQGIPGPQGPPGPQGVGGASAYTTLAQPFTVPPTGTSAIAFVTAADPFSTGLIVYVNGAGYFSVSGVDLTQNTLTLVNQNYPGDQPSGTVVPAGNTVSGTGPQGPVGPAGGVGPQGIQGPVGLAPTGTIVMYGAATAPGGWLTCNGSAISRTGFSALFSIISTTYGPGDGVSTFNLPNLAGRFPLGVGQSSAAGATNHLLGSTGGEETHTLALAELAAHSHTITDRTHSHSDPGHSHTGYTSTHGHTAHDTGHTHTYTWVGTGGGISSGGNPYGNVPGGANTGVGYAQIAIDAAAALSVQTYASYTGLAAAYTGINGTANSGSGNAHNTMPPFTTVQYIIKT